MPQTLHLDAGHESPVIPISRQPGFEPRTSGMVALKLNTESRAIIVPHQRPDKRAYDHATPEEHISDQRSARQQERHTNEDHVEQRGRRVAVAIVPTSAGDKQRQPRPRGAPNRLQQRRAVVVALLTRIGTATRVAADTTTCRSRILRSGRCERYGVTTRRCRLVCQQCLPKPQVRKTGGGAWPRVRILCDRLSL